MKKYGEKVIEAVNKSNDFIIVYTDYIEDKNGKLERNNINLRIKRLLNRPMKKQKNWVKIKVRRRILSMGNPICCPSVTYNKKAIDENLFDQQFKNFDEINLIGLDYL